MSERAKRFGLGSTKNSIANQEDDLYSSMGIIDDNDNKNMRLNVLHMRGTENMSTKDVFEYFKDYQPASIEWINDVSCNVVWLDKITAARALLGLSKKIEGLSIKNAGENDETDKNDCIEKNKESEDENMPQCDDKNEQIGNNITLKTIDFPLPPGLWRKGNNCTKSKTILLRFATINDKKQQNSEKLSEYYKKYGNPNFGGMKGILTDKRKRTYKEIRSKKRNLSDSDDNDDNKRIKNPWGSLSETWGTNDCVEEDFIRKTAPIRDEMAIGQERGSIKERLGFKGPPKERINSVPTVVVEDSASELSSDDDEEWGKRNKTLRMRMHADDEEEKVQKKKLKQLTKKIEDKVHKNDLRSRLGRSRPSATPVYRDAIQVIVTNEPQRYRSSGTMVVEDEEEQEAEEEEEIVEETVEAVEDEKEEGEWVEADEEIQPEVVDEIEEGEDDSSSDSNSDVSEKEVQGPKGSVIKVVSRAKPRVASTVWARLNHNDDKTDRYKL